MNQETPPLPILVRNSFLFEDEDLKKGCTKGHLLAVRSLQSQSLQFHVLLETGALYTGLPSNSLCFCENSREISIEKSCMWDNISSKIQVFTMQNLLYTGCTVKTEPDGEIVEAEYIFTIDYVGENDLSRHPAGWKMVHFLKGFDGNVYIYPQYRIKFIDPALCPKWKEPLPSYKHNDTIYKVGY